MLVNSVSPGIIATKRIQDIWKNRTEEVNLSRLKMIALQRLGTPEEVARIVYFLGSESNTYITGTNIDINGGMFIP